MAKLQAKVTRFLLIQDAEPRRAEPIPSMIAEALGASPKIADAETLLAEVYRLKNRRAEAS